MATLFDTESKSGAIFSPCRSFRYSLWRGWGTGDDDANCVAFIGLNPSTADETKDDPTIRRCIAFAKAWGYDGLYMLNLFAFRATLPTDMKAATDPIGLDNDHHLSAVVSMCSLTIAAWGNHGAFMNRGKIVAERFALKCLGTNKDGSPKHPLYLRADSLPVDYQPS